MGTDVCKINLKFLKIFSVNGKLVHCYGSGDYQRLHLFQGLWPITTHIFYVTYLANAVWPLFTQWLFVEKWILCTLSGVILFKKIDH